ncbi:PglL family O-oligosaccharyltransferase [Polaromonas sp.]|uniref:PglL family O-oligosaccharyltransferase n=1 Tax=Polaromonas sp. TaxID=1869339 RepID=UPI00375250A9
MPPPNPDQVPFIDSLPGLIQSPRNVHVWRRVHVFVLLVLIVPWVMPFAGNPSPSVWPWLTSAFSVGLLLLLMACVGPAALTAEMVRRGWVVAATLSAVVGAVQYAGLSEHFTPWMNLTRPGEAFGNLRQRNHFASLMGIGLVALIWHPRQSAGSYLPALLTLLALGNAASSSRTGALQWLAILLVAMVYSSRGRRGVGQTALLAFGVYLLWALVLPWLLVLLTGVHTSGLVARFEETPGCGSRLVLWSNVLTLIGEKPWFGWGWGELDHAHYMTLYPGQRFCDILDNAHNLPLHLAVELGIPVAVLILGSAGWLVLRARPWCETAPTRQMAWGVLALILLHSLLEYPLWYGPFQMAVGLCVYLLWTTRERDDPAGTPLAVLGTGRAKINYLLAATAALMMAVAAYAAWDYHRVSQIYRVPAQRDAAYRENTLEKIRDTFLFRHQFNFAALSLTPLTPQNALQIHTLSSELLHYSPEPRVIEKVIESAVMLRRDDEALLHLARYRAAFPENHAQWRRGLSLPNGLAP